MTNPYEAPENIDTPPPRRRFGTTIVLLSYVGGVNIVLLVWMTVVRLVQTFR